MARQAIRQSGFIFVVSMVALIVLLTLGLLSIRVATNNLRLTNTQRATTEATLLAEAAADMAEAYLRTLSTAPVNAVNYPATGTITLATGTCSAVITPIPNPYDPWSYYYSITGTGTSTRYGRTCKVIEQLSPRSFSMYGYFEDTGLSNNWWVSGISSFDGPFHTNAQLQVSWVKTAQAKDIIFHGTVDSSNSAIKWYNNVTPSTTAQWNTVASGGQTSISLGSDTIPFPTVADEQRTAAWGSATGAPTTQATADVYVQTPKGIYINNYNNSCDITFSSGGSSIQVITIRNQVYISNAWKDKYTEVTVNLPARTTSVRTKTMTGTNPAWTSPTVTADVPNGVIYSTGNITSISGTLEKSYVAGGKIVRPNNWTVATDYSTTAKKTVTITNDLTYAHLPDYVNYTAKSDYNLEVPALGIIGYQVIVDDTAGYVAGVKDDLNLHGVYMGIGSLSDGSVKVADITKKRLRGNLNIYGGTVVKTAAILGQFSGSNTLTYGYSEHYSYDVRMADGPLVAFPQTNQYSLIAWQYQ